MQYNPETGKRMKHQSGAIDWVHNKLKKSRQLLEDFNLQQCFFGEHLLNTYPEKNSRHCRKRKISYNSKLCFTRTNLACCRKP